MSTFRTFEGALGESFADEFRDAKGGYFVPSLPVDESSAKWRELVRDLHQVNIKGQGQTIAIIDSGFDTHHPALTLAVSGHVDLTGEGIEDRSGHGTLVSLLCLAVAPEAKLFHVKVLRRDGGAAGGASESSVIAKAIREAGHHGANIVNLSGGRYREGEESYYLLDPLATGWKALTSMCDC